MVRILFFDIGFTLVDETPVWRRRCEEQASSDEAKRLGLTAGEIYHEIEKASAARLSQYKSVIKKYGFSEAAPYRHELKVLYKDAPPVLGELSERFALGVIANQSEGLDKRLRQFGIDRYFPWWSPPGTWARQSPTDESLNTR